MVIKHLDLNVYGVEAMSKQEMQKEDGGILVFLAIAAIGVLATSCTLNINTGSGNIINNSTTDSTSVKPNKQCTCS